MKIAMFFKMADSDMDLDEIINVGENLKHTRAYYWLELFNEFEIEDWAYISKYVKKEELVAAIQEKFGVEVPTLVKASKQDLEALVKAISG